VAGAVAQFRPGDDVDAVLACTRKDRLTARSGSAYLALELSDRTGRIAGRAFRDADRLAGRFDRGDLVRVRGRVERFREELQLEVHDIARAAGEQAAPGGNPPRSGLGYPVGCVLCGHRWLLSFGSLPVVPDRCALVTTHSGPEIPKLGYCVLCWAWTPA